MLIDTTNEQRPERFLLALVRSARAGHVPHGRTRRHVYRAARARRRKLAAMCVVMGPFAGAGVRVTEVYGEAATVCDVADTHRLGLSDELVAAHLLVLWSITDALDTAHAAVEGRGTSSVTGLLASRLRERSGAVLPERWTKRSAAMTLWKARGVATDRRGMGLSAVIGAFLRPGRGAKRFIARAERQLGVPKERGDRP